MILHLPMLTKKLTKSLLMGLIFIGTTLTVSAQCPVIDAGPAASICETDSYTTSTATGSDFASVLWTSSGTGNFINDDKLIATYTPSVADINAESVILTLTAIPFAGCTSGLTYTSQLILTFNKLPTVEAGSDFTMCSSETPTIQGTATGAVTTTWSSSGNGTFDNENNLNTTFTPSPAEIAAGFATLTLSVESLPSCAVTYTDNLTITITPAPIVSAGNDETICQGSLLNISTATATNHTSITWTSNGDGIFDNEGIINPIYTPGINDIVNGSIELTLLAVPTSPCSNNISDVMTLTVISTPTVNAGNDFPICESESANLNGTASNYSTIEWTTTGDGIFSDAANLNTIYYPGTNDRLNGLANITLTALAIAPCTTNATSNLQITISPLPTVYAGSNTSNCGQAEIQLNGTATHYSPSSIVWSGGTGSFNSTSILDTKYTPSVEDVVAGTVTLTLTVSGQSPCNTNISDNIAIALREPAVNAGGDVLACNGEALIVSNSTARDVTVVWNTSGTGTFDDNSVVNPTYHPSANDYLHPPITLTMTGTAVAPCTSTIVDQMQILSFIESPTVFSGYDTTICQTGSYETIFASTNGEESSVQWSTGGNGSFGGNQNQLQATYTPGTIDISRGYADLTLTAYPNSPCANQVTHSFRLSIQRLPVVSAGDDEYVCEGSSIEITTASVSFNDDIEWTTNGSGTFSSTTVINPTYFPSAADIVSGVVLSLTATSSNPCSGSISDSMTLTGIEEPEGNAGADADICEINTYYLGDATATNYSNLVWTTSGDGGFSNTNILHPTYTPGVNDISSGNATLELTIVARTPCTTSIVDAMTITLAAAPIITAGSDIAICAGSTYTTIASVANHSSFEWTTSGDGSFVNSSSVNNIYTPGTLDIENGSVILTLTATGITPCEGDFSDHFTLTINKNPTANAGSDETICSTAFTLTNATATNYSSLSWISDGSSGTLTNANTLTPTYTASAADIIRGYVNLTLTANTISPCGNTATDEIRLDIQPLATADAGADAHICASDTYTIVGANVDNQSSYRWTTSGNGTFINATNQLNPTYTPSAADIASGNVRLTLNVSSIAPCGIDVSDEMILTIEPLPVVDAGSNSSVCKDGSFTTTEARAENYSSLLWTSSGDGTFGNPNVINTNYTPGATDLINGSFRLTLSAESNSPCSTTISDFMDVSIVYLPTANAGPDVFERCSGDSYTIIGTSATNYSSINWTTSGSGIITNANSLNPTYTLSENDALLGTVTLSMEVTGSSPCNVTITDAFLMYVIPDVIVFAGTDFSICEGSSFTITDATATNHSALSWSSSGTGVFANQTTITPTYTPSTEDIAAGSVNLILTGTGNSLCSEKSDNIIVTINKNPIVNAGTTTDICSVPSLIQGATAEHYESLSWSSSGTGIFNFGNTLTPTYTPSAVDVATGVVTFTLTATPNNPCSTNTTSSIQVNIHQAPMISAGDDATVCEGETYSLITASSAHVTNMLWTTSGTGVFADPHIANTVYTPSELDATLGNVTLTLTGGNLTCTDETDYMVLTIQRMPQVYAGKDSTLCENGSYVVRDAVIRNYSSLLWTHNGTGTLTGATTISPVYTAGSGDVSAGSVTLNVAVTANSPCVGITNDVLTLVVKHLPTVYAGADTTICETGNYVIVGAAATDYESISWSSAGTGTFLHVGTLTPTYFPSQEDIDRGNVVLRMHVSNSPCNVITDQMTLSFGLLPQVNAGFDAGVNFGTSFDLNSSSVSNNNGISWSTSGTGVFSSTTTLHPNYTPSAQDFAIGHVVLTLTAYGILPCGEVSDEMILNITDNPDVAFTWENACVSTIMQFLIDRNATDIDSIVSWDWDFGDGNTSTAMEPAHLYSNTGTYTVSLTVVDVNNYTSKITNNVIISPLPVANFNYTSPSCSNLATVFSDYSNTAVGYITEWHYTFGDGTEQTITFPENPNITHQYASHGVYNVLLTVTSSAGCSNSISKDIVIVPSPEANFSMNSYCLSGSADFEDLSQDNSGGEIVEWFWDFGDPDSGISNSSTLRHPSHLYENSGIYNVSLQITNANGCTSTSIQSFDIVIQQEVDFYVNGSTCVNNSKQFFIDTRVVNMINVQTILWDFGDGSLFSTVQNPTHTYTNTGVYNVTLNINNNGCESSVTYPVTVHPTPTAIFEYSNACANSLTDFFDRSSEANYQLANWSWDFGDPNRSDDYATIRNASYGYSESGFYNVGLTVTDENGCSDTTLQPVEIFPSPTSAFSIENNYENTQGRIQLINESVDAIEYNWIFGDGGASNEENPIYSYMEDGNYTIELFSWNTYSCSDTSSTQYQLSFKGLYIPSAFSPNNPNEDVSKFKAIGMNLMNFRIEIYDNRGTLLWESELLDENGSPSEEWDGTYKGQLLPQGVYVWKASAVFIDGSIWGAKDLGNNTGSSGKPSGTVTLIR